MVITGSPLCDRQLPRRGVACPGHVHDMSGTCPIGSCPGEAWERKGAACKRLQRGGECAHSRRAGDATGHWPLASPRPFHPPYRTWRNRRPDGSPTCTWRLHPMGEVRVASARVDTVVGVVASRRGQWCSCAALPSRRTGWSPTP